MKKRIRVSYNLKPETIELVKKASQIFNEDMSSIVDQALTFRLKYINDLKPKIKLSAEEKSAIKVCKVAEKHIEIFIKWFRNYTYKNDPQLFSDWTWADDNPECEKNTGEN